MTTNDYLKITGYSAEEWAILNEEESKVYSSMPGAVGFMYPISDRKFVKEIGKNYNLVSLKWMQKQTIEPKKTLEEAKVIIDEVIPSAVPPPPIKNNVPSPPPTITKEELTKQDKEIIGVDSNEFYCEQENQTGNSCSEQCESCKNKEDGVPEEAEVQKIKEIIKETGAPKDNVIIGNIPEQNFNWRKDRIKQLEDLGLVLDGDNYLSPDKTYGMPIMAVDKSKDEEWKERMDKLTNHIKSLTPQPMTLERKISLVEKNCGMVKSDTYMIHLATGLKTPINALENMDDKTFNEFVPQQIEFIAKREKANSEMTKVDSSIPQSPKMDASIRIHSRNEKLISIGLSEEEFQYGNGTQAISKEWIKSLSDEEFNKEFDRILKSIRLDEELEKMKVPEVSEEMKKDADEAIEKIVDIVTANDKTINDFEFIDNLIDTATLFKKSIYAIALIKNTLKCDDLTPSKKIALIEKHIQNIK